MRMRSFHLFLQKRNRNLQKNNKQIKQLDFLPVFLPVFEGGADFREMCPAHHCSWVGACALRAGVGPSAPFHDQEGSHQHRCAGSKTASAPRNILLCERPHLHKIITHLWCHVKFLLFLLLLIFLCFLAPCTFYDFMQKNVIIIGAGASGLAAARQLQNFGTQVKILISPGVSFHLPWLWSNS